MQISETSSDGLKRAYKVVVGADAIEADVQKKLAELGQRARLPGFRPGKVPSSVLRARFGKSVMGEVLQETLDKSLREALDEQKIRPALQPKVEVTAFDQGTDLEYTMEVEVLPEFEPADLSGVKLERMVAEVADAEVDAAVANIAEQQRTYTAEEGAAAGEGDAVLIDFEGKIDGEPFEGGNGTDSQVRLGSGQFVPGFEDQLVGAEAGEEREVKVTFPSDYPYEKLRGQTAVFDVKVKEVRRPSTPQVDDALATSLGLENLAQLKERVREQITQEYASVSRERLKRQLLDRLDEMHSFDLPPTLVENEFNAIWQQIERDREAGSLDADDAAKPEDDLKADYRRIAERRVRLGLLLSKVGEANDIKVAQDELNRAMARQAQRFPGQEQQVYTFYRDNPQAAMQLQAPLFEDKVIDFLLELASVEQKTVTKDELFADPEEGEAAPAEAEKKPAKRAAKKKTASDAAEGEAEKKPAKRKTQKDKAKG